MRERIEALEEELDSAVDMITRQQDAMDAMVDVLQELKAYFNDRQDADCVGDPPRYVPNEAMRKGTEVQRAIDAYWKVSRPKTEPTVKEALKACYEELLLLTEECDHSVGICWCPAHRALENAEKLLGLKPTRKQPDIEGEIFDDKVPF